ncbi:MAG: diguanylate cyclase [Thermodesulfobacteriota bacterium]|nr:diguanylate cyclase [Thermodesulfobacteriota bacterium]
MKLELKNGLNTRVLVVDDNQSIHDDFRKTLADTVNEKSLNVKDIEAMLFEDEEKEIQAEAVDLTRLNYKITDAYQGEEAVELVRQGEQDNTPYALIFMDVRMPPGINGIKAISKIWDINPHIEVVICSAYSDYSWDEIVQKLGNTDRLLFLKKPFTPVEVKQMAHSLVIKWNLNHQNRHLIENLEQEVKARTQQLEDLYIELEVANRVLEEKNKLLEEVAQRDGLTGLFNHVALNERLRCTISEARRYHFPLSVVMIDIDHFKQFNDYYGHQLGDEIIKKVASLLQINLRQYDVKLRFTEVKPVSPETESEKAATPQNIDEAGVAGRYGGDEFILILPYCGYDETDAILTRLRDNIISARIEDYPDIKITASIGAAVLSQPGECNDCNPLIKLADEALYNVKNSGRDQICILEFGKDGN